MVAKRSLCFCCDAYEVMLFKLCVVTAAGWCRFEGKVVTSTDSGVADLRFKPTCIEIFPGRVIPVTSKLALQWLPRLALQGQGWDWLAWCQYTVTGWDGKSDQWSATCVSVWQNVQWSEQICPWDTQACCWDIRQPTNKRPPLLPSPAGGCCGMSVFRKVVKPLGIVAWPK